VVNRNGRAAQRLVASTAIIIDDTVGVLIDKAKYNSSITELPLCLYRTQRLETCSHAGRAGQELIQFGIVWRLGQLLMAWAKQFPVTAWEQERNKRITTIMGPSQPLVTGEHPWASVDKPTGDGVVSTLPPRGEGCTCRSSGDQLGFRWSIQREQK
jgi:hypothetical protein